jgi:hypothetical protein
MGDADDIRDGFKKITGAWTRQKKSEERKPDTKIYRGQRLARVSDRVKIKDAAEEVMEEAYMAASANGTLPATARQVMYAARPSIQDATGENLVDSYFTQTLLPDYVRENDLDWDIVYDERGHFEEPHTEERIGLGTLAVREYLDDIDEPTVVDVAVTGAKIKTKGAAGCFDAVLFIEKEGFLPLFYAVDLAERFDLALMSTKGMSVTAARRLIDEMCGEDDIPVYVLHDFDPYGFSIFGTLGTDNRRYEYVNAVSVIDIGLRLDDVNSYGLAFETQHLPKNVDRDRMQETAMLHGATEAECAAMFSGADRSIQRVELNALHSDQLIELIEKRLREHGVGKVIPDQDLLEQAYRGYAKSRKAEAEFSKIMESMADDKIAAVPTDLHKRVVRLLKKNPTLRWDEAVAAIVDAATR